MKPLQTLNRKLQQLLLSEHSLALQNLCSPWRAACRAASMLLWPAAGSSWLASSLFCAACLPWKLAWRLCGYETRPEKDSVSGLNGWLDCLRDVLTLSNFHLMVHQSPLQLIVLLLLIPCSPVTVCLCSAWLGSEVYCWVHLWLWGGGGFDGNRAIDPASCRSVSAGRERKSACCWLVLHVN